MEKKDFSYETSDGRVIRYALRSLESEDEIIPWAIFCASVFSYKESAPPPSYFERHFFNDPRRDVKLVLVAEDVETGMMVSSCRIFSKTISAGAGQTREAGGIGEVCTSIAHRKRGLSRALLRHALDVMTTKMRMELAFLHAAPAFFPVYHKAGGFECTRTSWTVLTLTKEWIRRMATAYRRDTKSVTTARLASFPSDTEQLKLLHMDYSQKRFSGCVIRTKQYWNDYIRKEVEGTLHVLDIDDELVAWISVRQRGTRYQIRDFGCKLLTEENRNTKRIETFDALMLLLERAMCERGASDDSFGLSIPTAIWEEAKTGKNAPRPPPPPPPTQQPSGTGPKGSSTGTQRTTKPSSTSTSNSALTLPHAETAADLGWMYKTLQPDAPSMVKISETIPHLIWPVDSF